MRYRTDIDGLRAVAVLPVVAFHAQIPQVPGGFIGVDVFFVISGYLISSIILSEVESGRFSLASFYERRIRRIFPALIAMLLVSSALACIYLLPTELEAFAKSLAAAMFSASNFYFWSGSGYFDVAAEQQPLLHTWSLAVEEQFYLLFPLLLMSIRRVFPGRLRSTIIAIAVASFVLSEIDVRTAPARAFYFPHARAWELLLGTVLAMNVIPTINARWANNLISAGGLGLIAFAVLTFEPGTPFPGAYALIPCLGAAMIIHAGRDTETVTSRLLSWKPLVFIGLISYSLYLWHWPLIYFQNNFSILFAGLPGPLGKALLVLASILIAAMSWWFIERPFRAGPLRPSKRLLFVMSGAATAAICGIAVGVLSSQGMGWRFSTDELQAASYLKYDPSPAFRKGDCFATSDAGDDPSFAELKNDPCLRRVEGRRNFLLFGDSYAADLWFGLSHAMRDINWLQATGAGCKPLFDAAALDLHSSERCARLRQLIFAEYLVKNPVDAVLVGGSWTSSDIPKLARTLDWANAAGIPVVLLGPKIQYDAPLPRLLVAALGQRDVRLPDRHRVGSFRDLDNAIAGLARAKGVIYVSYFDLLCENDACQYADANGRPLAFDRAHFTKWGSVVFAEKVRSIALPGLVRPVGAVALRAPGYESR
ncbi:MAG: acyltransferase family protein [Pseudomonadota bacterium]